MIVVTSRFTCDFLYLASVFMSISSAAVASTMPRLPGSWKEFSDLVRANQASANSFSRERRAQSMVGENQSVMSLSDPGFRDTRFSSQFSKSQLGNGRKQSRDCHGANNPCDSPPVEFIGEDGNTDRIDIWV